MDSDRWKQIESLVETVLELPEDKRTAWLDENCNGDETLRVEVESLLAVENESDNFLNQSPIAEAAQILFQSEVKSSVKDKHIGQYKLLREIGRGGMGVVYLAAREDEQFRKRVAIKLVKRGLDTEDVLRRFRNERQILASLHHPNIASLLDGGTTEDGLPYFVMEYIEGSPLIEYSDEHQLTTTERLELFRTICSAVGHAHQNLVIHRDLKPSNILITNEGELKLLDFGIAKFLNPELMSDDLAKTQTLFRVMTPEYASPEQVKGKHVTTSTDIYSLGVILYELLTGTKPYILKDTSPAEMLNVICDSEPTKPSEAVITHQSSVSRKSNGQRTRDNGNNRQSATHSAGNRHLRGDLDNIVLMALRKEPSRRYKSVEQFSEDIERHLKGLPVIARKDTFAYRTEKFIQRNKIAVIASSLVAMALMVGLIATIWQARVANEQRDRAESEKLKAQAVSEVVQRMLNYSNPVLNMSGKNGDDITIREVLDETAKRLDTPEFANQPEVRAELERIIAESYFYQGKYDLGSKHIQKFIELTAQLYGENNDRTLIADSYRAGVLFSNGDLDKSEKLFRRVLPLLREGQKKGEIKTELLARALNDFGYLRRTQGNSKEAEMAFRETLELMPQIALEQRFLVNLTRSTLASTIADQGRFEEALQTSSQAVAEYRQNNMTNIPDYGFALTVYGGFLTDKGNFAEAETVLKNAETIFRKTLTSASLWLGDNLRNQAILLYKQGKYPEAMSKATETLKIYDGFGKHYDHYPTVLSLQGLILCKTGKPQEGEKLAREALQIRTETLKKEHYFTSLAKSALGECLAIQKRFDEAEPLLKQSYEELIVSQGEQNPRTLLAQSRLTALYQQWKKPNNIS